MSNKNIKEIYKIKNQLNTNSINNEIIKVNKFKVKNQQKINITNNKYIQTISTMKRKRILNIYLLKNSIKITKHNKTN